MVPTGEYLPLNVVQSVDVRSPVFTADAFRKREEVAIAEGTPEAPMMFPRTEFAAIAARPMVPVVVIVPPVMPLFVAIEVTVPEPPPPVLRQTPLMAQHPSLMFSPPTPFLVVVALS